MFNVYCLLTAFLPAVITDQSSSEPSSAPLDADIFRDGPLYPPLQDSILEHDTTELNQNPYTDDKNLNYENNQLELELSNENLNERLEEPQNIFEMFDDNNLDLYETNPFKPINEVSERGFIVAPGANSDEVRSDDARVDDKVVEDDARIKRSSGWDKSTKSRRVKTGDTILNIRGAVRDAIGDAGAAPGPRASSRVDAFVIRPSPVMRDEPRDQAREAEARREKVQAPQPQKLDKELLVEAHARARLVCDLVNATNLKWYKDNEQMNLPLSPDGGESAYRDGDAVEIPRASRNHAAKWRCGGRDRSGRPVVGQPTRLLIYEPVRSVYLAVDGRRLDAGNTWVPVRDKTVLEVKCVAEGGVPPPELSWRLLALEPALDHRPYLRIHPTNYSMDGMYWSRVVVTAARELHNATLQCEAKQRKPLKDNTTKHYDVMTAKLEIHVTYPPSFVISRWPGFGVSLWAGSPAALRCDVDSNPPARPAWTRDSDIPLPQSSPAPMESADGSATLRWSRLHSSHAGWYQCRATWLNTEYSSIGYYLNVLSPDESVQTSTEANEEPIHQKVEVPLGGNVQLHCPKGSVGCWWRRVVGNASDSWAPAGSHHAHGVLGAATAKSLGTDIVSKGWRLTCSVCGRNVRVKWVLTSGRSEPGIITQDTSLHCWRASLITTDTEEIWCVAVSTGGGAVAVFPKRTLNPSVVRALHSGSLETKATFILLIFSIILLTPFS
ncbi:unnamed protein product [Leptosia nina]|uniref:Ig-like domain-containing protein n=1 Tax=Leptosia nina TaxID=320188 RepID=A0AAV1JI10_9NEOP